MNYETLERLLGAVLPSEGLPGVTFRLESVVGAGGVGIVFLATRFDGATELPVVIKVLRPSLVSAGDAAAPQSVRKEAVALGRLNEHVPPTPFVVRLVDAGELDFDGVRRLRLPWLAIEAVNGGEEGTTLEERVRFACEKTGSAFDPARASRTLRCLASGLVAIHGVGVVHRDLTPGNVLCCGFGESELCKISDFGLSRSTGMQETFGQVLLGTPGYASPEQSFPIDAEVGPHSDVFSFACLAYFVLTGEPYFQAKTLPQALMLTRAPERRSLLDARYLAPELRERPDVCEAVDRALGLATAFDVAHRPQHVQYLGAMLAPLFAVDGTARPSQRHVDSVSESSAPGGRARWAFTVRHPPGDGRVIHSAAWDADASCLAATTEGLEFWSGVRWRAAPTDSLPFRSPVRFVHRVDAGVYLVAAETGDLALYTFEGTTGLGRVGGGAVRLVAVSGQPSDLLVVVAERPGGAFELWTRAAGRWLRPLPVPQAASVMTLSRVDDARWLIGGRARSGQGFAALFEPLEWELVPLMAPQNRAYIAADGLAEKGTGLIAGASGHVIHVERTRTSLSRLPGDTDVSAVALDVFDRSWAASLGRLWLRERGGDWVCLFQDLSCPAPFIRLLPDAGVLVALTADGGVIEGRAATGGP